MGDRTDLATDRVAHVPIRTCVGCRRSRPKDALVRVAERGGMVVPDRQARAPGRGAYLCADASCLQRALRRGAPLLRALRAGPGVAVDDEALEDALQQERGREHDDHVVRE